MSTDNEHITIGPPGTGKTTWLSRQVERAVEKDHNIMVISLTKTSAAEVAGRDLPIPERQIGTLHSQCYRALQGAAIAENATHAKDWNERFPQYRITGVSNENDEEGRMEQEAAQDGDSLLNNYKILRGKMTPRSQWDEKVLAFAKHWEEWKENEQLLDFTDLIQRALEEVDTAPGNPDVIMADEAQDMDAQEMALVKKWGANGMLVVVGDPDQCQPEGTMVRTKNGEVPIEKLAASKERIITWNSSKKNTEAQPKDFPVNIAWRRHSGRMLTIRTKSSVSRSTAEHIWIAKIRNRWIDCVWLHDGLNGWECFAGPVNRAFADRSHRGGRTWLLTTCGAEEEAERLARGMTAKLNAAGAKPQEILEQYGRDPGYPLINSHQQHEWAKDQRVTARACNLQPGLMGLPVANGNGEITWECIEDITTDAYEGKVYSLAVEPHKTYVSDGIVTHNCLYEWRGSDPKVLMTTGENRRQRRVLEQSYRLSKRVHAKAMEWIDRCPGRQEVAYRPRDEEGEVRYLDASWRIPETALDDAERYLQDGKTVMIVASCSYMMDPAVAVMRKRALPFHNPLRAKNGAWNPLNRTGSGNPTSKRILDFCHLNEFGHWNADHLRSWGGMVKLREVFAGGKGIAKRLEDLVDDDAWYDGEPCLSWDALYSLLNEDAIEAGLTADVQWLQSRLNKARQGPAQYPMEIIRRRGPDSIRNEPQILAGTVNSFKGGEADVVYLFPDLSAAGTAQWRGTREERAAIYRLFYVGMTRARETLILCRPAGGRAEDTPGFWQGEDY